MPKGYKPAVFVSSTCYDLSQIREDLKSFIESIGLDPVLSEKNSFPVNPNIDTVGNCLDVVNDRADILVLIVGDKYGFQTENGKSITNLEYITAINKGVPIYIFVKKSIINILSVWKNNKDGDYTGIVDSPKLLEFVESLREKSNSWVFPFEDAQEISATLKNQLAYLFMDSLECRSAFQGKLAVDEFKELSPKSLELVFTKPDFWEYLLFAQILKDKISSYQTKRFDLIYGVNFSESRYIDNAGILGNMLSNRISEIKNTIESITRLTNNGLPIAFGESGKTGDEKHIVYIATRISDAYKNFIDWTLELTNIDSPEDLNKIIQLSKHLTDQVIPDIENFSEKLYTDISNAVDNVGLQNSNKTIVFELVLEVPDMAEYFKEIDRLKRKYD